MLSCHKHARYRLVCRRSGAVFQSVVGYPIPRSIAIPNAGRTLTNTRRKGHMQ